LCKEKSKSDLRTAIWEASLHGCKKSEINKMKASLQELENELKESEYKVMSQTLDQMTKQMVSEMEEKAAMDGNARRKHSVKDQSGGSEKSPR
jgi:hypothetical protein